jgi:hypothetical protein
MTDSPTGSPTPDPVTRLGPDSGGRVPGEGSVRVYTWEWGPDSARRPGLPWIGIFLLIFGGLLLIQQVSPAFKDVGSVVVLAIGLAFLVQWAITRATGSLYAGALITALAAPGVLNALGVNVDGLSTFSFGVAFLFIALVRAASGGGWGWQAWFGGLLAIVGFANITNFAGGAYLVPLLLIAVGAVLLIRGMVRND